MNIYLYDLVCIYKYDIYKYMHIYLYDILYIYKYN